MAGSAGACNQRGLDPSSPWGCCQPHPAAPALTLSFSRLLDVMLQDFCDRGVTWYMGQGSSENGITRCILMSIPILVTRNGLARVVEAGKSKICRASALVSVQRLAGCSRSRRRMPQLEGSQAGRIPYSRGGSGFLFCPDLQLIGCGPPTSEEGSLLFRR